MELGYFQYKPLVQRFLRQANAHFGKNFASCALFGSLARGQGKPESDVDLLVIFKKKDAELEEKIIHLLVESDSWPEKLDLFSQGIFGSLSVISRTEEELAEDPLILLDVMDQGIILYDPDKVLRKLFFKLRQELKKLGAKKVVLADGSWYWDLKPDWKPGEIVEVKL